MNNDLAKSVKKNPKAFWQYSNSKLKTKERMGDFETENGQTTSQIRRKQVLSRFFKSVFTMEDLSDIPTLDVRYNGCLKQKLRSHWRK